MKTQAYRGVGGPAADAGPTSSTTPTLRDVTDLSVLAKVVVASLSEGEGIAASSLGVFSDLMYRFARFCGEGLGVTDVSAVEGEHVLAFAKSLRRDGAEPTVSTQHLRRGAVRLMYKEGRRRGWASGDPTVDAPLPPRSHLPTRPLTDDEVDLCRLNAVVSSTDHRRGLVWALAETTARVSEIAQVRVRDVDLSFGLVHIAGSTRTTPRWAPATEWALARFAVRLRDPKIRETDLLVPWRYGRSPTRPANAATMGVIETLRAAGIHDEPDVRPASVTGWAGARLLHEGRTIEEAARALGCRSLDRAAEMVGFDWASAPDGEPG